jgi:hypothetical protein
MNAFDTIVVLRARAGKCLAKRICRDGAVEDYGNAYRFDIFEQPVADLDALRRLLDVLSRRPDCCVVRGVPIDRERTVNVRRLAHADRETGDPATLRDVPHRWVALDMEGIDRPEGLAASDLGGCAAEAVRRLPLTFSRARCIVQASASHGLKPDCRLRLWHWLDRPTTGAELSRWLRGRPADPTVFRTVQPIYTAAPVFEAGLLDHLPRRILELPGEAAVAVPSPEALKPPPPRAAAPLPSPTSPGAGRYAFAALVNAAARVRRAAIGQRHDTILREARSLARFVAGGLLTERDISATLRAAGTDAGKPDAEIEHIMEWALARPSLAPLPRDIEP